MKKYQHNIIKFYLYAFFRGAVFAYVIERLFWASRGMTIQDVVFVEIIYSVIVVVSELPTGMIADRFSRKTWIVIDALFTIIEMFILIFAHDFWHFTVAIVFAAIGRAFWSGSFNSLLYDSLRILERTDEFEKQKGRITAIDYSAVAICSLIGGIVATNFTLVSTYWLSLISLVLAFIISLTIYEVRVGEQKSEQWTLKDWGKIFGFVIHKKNIRFIMTIGMVTGGVLVYLDEFWQIYLDQVSVPVIFFGIVIVAIMAVAALGNLVAYRWKQYLGLKRTFQITLLCSFMAMLMLSMIKSWYGIFGMLLIYFLMSVIEPIIYGYIHHEALPEYRATIESAYSLMTKGAVALVGIPFGILSTKFSIFIGFGYLAVVLLILSIFFNIFGKKDYFQVELEEV